MPSDQVPENPVTDDVEQQAAIATSFMAAIMAIEAQLAVADNAITAPTIDPAAENLDADAVQQLLGCLGDANQQVAQGELALVDLGLKEEAHA